MANHQFLGRKAVAHSDTKPSSESQGGFLIPCDGGIPIALRKSKFRVGRSAECEVVINERTVSSRHCELELVNGYWQLRDLGSRNGTTVDGLPYQWKQIAPGSVVGFASKQFRLEYVPEMKSPEVDEIENTRFVNLTVSNRFELWKIRSEKYRKAAESYLPAAIMITCLIGASVVAREVAPLAIATMSLWLLFSIGDRLGLTGTQIEGC